MQTKILRNCVFLTKFNKIVDELLWASADGSRNGPRPSQAELGYGHWSFLLHQEYSSNPTLVPANTTVSKITPGCFLEINTSQDPVQKSSLEMTTVLWRVSDFNTRGLPCQLASGTRT